jgi:hypothetical protein
MLCIAHLQKDLVNVLYMVHKEDRGNRGIGDRRTSTIPSSHKRDSIMLRKFGHRHCKSIPLGTAVNADYVDVRGIQGICQHIRRKEICILAKALLRLEVLQHRSEMLILITST